MIGREHLCRYVAWAAAKVEDVEGVKKLNQSPLLQGRQPQRSWQKVHRQAAKAANEPQRDVEPQLGHAVDRHKHSRTSRCLLVGQADVNFTGSVGDYQLTAIGIDPLDEGSPKNVMINGRIDVEAGRRRLEDQR
ncbi:hypothetical protein J2R96_004986 [Bradyrhizobium elkanii]|nr:hypothetical protein [Bradyrhizobium elkanii]